MLELSDKDHVLQQCSNKEGQNLFKRTYTHEYKKNKLSQKCSVWDLSGVLSFVQFLSILGRLVRTRPMHDNFSYTQEFINSFMEIPSQVSSSVIFPYFPLRESLSVLQPAFSLICLATAILPVNNQWETWGKKKKKVKLPAFWQYFELWYSFPIHLLLFTSQSHQTASPCLLSWFYISIYW